MTTRAALALAPAWLITGGIHPAGAQTGARLTGVVRGESGGVLPGVTVGDFATIANEADARCAYSSRRIGETFRLPAAHLLERRAGHEGQITRDQWEDAWRDEREKTRRKRCKKRDIFHNTVLWLVR